MLPARLQEEDKVKHMVWSFWLTAAALLTCSPLAAFALVFLLGLVKEFWDEYFGSGFCFFDMAGNVVGSLFALGGFFMIALVWRW